MIQKAVQDPLAQLLLAGELADGSVVKISAAHGALTINGKAFGAEADASKPTKPATVVNFPKGG